MVILEPIMMKRFYVHSNGAIPGRGTHRGKKILCKWIHNKKFRYFVKADIRHYYDSIDKNKLIEHLETFIADDWLIHLIKLCLTHYNKGIPIGFYLSQWLGNSFLTEMDNLIVKSGRKLYMRYMDDIVICGNNKKDLHKLICQIKQHLGKCHLKLKGSWQVCRFAYNKKNGKRIGRPIDFMGFKFYRDRTVVRKNIIKNMRTTVSKIRKAKENGNRIYLKWAAAMLSQMGWIRHSNTYELYLINVKPYVEIRKMKQLISKSMKKEKRRKRRYDRVEKRNMRHRVSAGIRASVA